MKTVLVVDDEPKIVQLARDYLEHAGFAVRRRDGEAALAARLVAARSRRARPRPAGLDGLDVARALRCSSDVPIVMLTARGDEADRIVGLELGADDYVTKPFSPKELVARVRAVLRRADGRAAARQSSAPATSRSTFRGCGSRRAAGRSSSRRPSSSCSRRSRASRPRVHARPAARRGARRRVRVVRARDRRAREEHPAKLEPDPREPRYLLTVYGVGYRFADA